MSNKEQIETCINIYYEGCCESDPAKIKEAFDQNAMISGYLPDGLHEMNLDEFAGFVDAQKPSPKEKGEPARLEIVSIEIAGETAVARVRDDYLGQTFLDTLSLVKLEGDWSIYNKLYHIEGKA